MTKSNFSFEDVKNLFYINKSRNASFLEYYKNYLMYVMDRQTELDKDEKTRWMANVKSPTTFFITSTLYGMYLTSQTQFSLTKRITDDESEKLSEKIIGLNQYYYDMNETSENMDRIAMDSLLLGTWFWQVCYTKVSDEVRMMKAGWKKDVSKEYNIPSIEHINAMDIFIDSAAKSIYNSRFVVVRKIKNKNSLNSYYKDILGGQKIDLKKLESWEILETKDWNMVIRYMMFNNMPGVNNAWAKPGTTIENNIQHYDILTDNSFRFWEKKDWQYIGDLVEVFEVHTDNDITLFVNGQKYGAFEKSFPRRKKPFFSIKNKESLNMLYGLGSWYLAYNLQKMSDMFLNLRMDLTRLESTAPIAVDSGDSYFDGQDVFKPYPWQIVKLTDPQKWWRKLEYWYNPNLAGQEVEQITKMVQDSFGLSWYSMGIQQKVERVARWVQELVDSVDRAFAWFVRSYWQAMSFIQKYWTVMTVSTVNKEYLSRVLGDDIVDIKDIDIADIVYEYKFGFNLQPMKKASDMAMVQSYIQFLQTQWQATRPDWTPLVDQEFVIDQIIEKMDLPAGTKLTAEEAMEYMKEQIKRNAELKKEEESLLPQPQVDEKWNPIQWGWIVPPFNQPQKWTKKMVDSVPPGEPRVTNPEWINSEI